MKKFLVEKQAGVTLVELILALLVVSALIIILSNLPSSLSAISRNRNGSIARDAASKQMEYLRRLGYDNLPPTGSFSDSSLNSLPFATASFEVDPCPVTICTSGDPNREPAKLVKVDVSWNESGDNKKIDLTTLISKGGLGQ